MGHLKEQCDFSVTFARKYKSSPRENFRHCAFNTKCHPIYRLRNRRSSKSARTFHSAHLYSKVTDDQKKWKSDSLRGLVLQLLCELKMSGFFGLILFSFVLLLFFPCFGWGEQETFQQTTFSAWSRTIVNLRPLNRIVCLYQKLFDVPKCLVKNPYLDQKHLSDQLCLLRYFHSDIYEWLVTKLRYLQWGN